ncbi:hypothetical protein D3C77_538240 [compost metagenome]
MAIDQVRLDGAGVAVLFRVIAVGLEHVQVEEISAPFISTAVAKLVDLLLDFLVHGWLAVMLTVAKADKGVAPLRRIGDNSSAAQG